MTRTCGIHRHAASASETRERIVPATCALHAGKRIAATATRDTARRHTHSIKARE